MSNANLAPNLSSPPRCDGIVIDVVLDGAEPTYIVSLLRPDGTLKSVATTRDETAARRGWCLFARVLRCPRHVAEVDGGVRAIETVHGHLVSRDPVARRRRGTTRRRPISRRNPPLSSPPQVHAGEREIICCE